VASACIDVQHRSFGVARVGHQTRILWIYFIQQRSYKNLSSQLQQSQYLICNVFNVSSRHQNFGIVNDCKMSVAVVDVWNYNEKTLELQALQQNHYKILDLESQARQETVTISQILNYKHCNKYFQYLILQPNANRETRPASSPVSIPCNDPRGHGAP
jgi:hypothetical protein